MSTALTTIEGGGQLAPQDEEWSVERMVGQAMKIQQCMSAVMKRDEHYGVIPGTKGQDGKDPKPTLLKPGAEKLCLMFRLCPEYEIIRAVQTSELVSYTVRCTLIHIPTGSKIATGLGSCNSREKKHSRPADKKCPGCGNQSLIVGKPEFEKDPAFKGGWICYAKKGGCGAKYKPGDETITKQAVGTADPSDLDNSILKIGCKRALVAAVLNGTAASDCFTQDLEDLASAAAEYQPPVKPQREQRPQDPRAVENLGPTDLHADRKEAAPAAPKAPAVDVPATPVQPTAPTAATVDAAVASVTAAFPGARVIDTGIAASMESQLAIGHRMTELRWKKPAAKKWLKDLFGFETLGALTQKQADTAIALLLAHGTGRYAAMLIEAEAKGEILPEAAA